MSDAIAPFADLFEFGLASLIAIVVGLYRFPESKAEATKIRAQIPGSWVSSIQGPIFSQQTLYHSGECWVFHSGNYHLGCLGMDRATEPLEVSGEQGCVCEVDLLRENSSSRAGSLHFSMD